MSIPWVVAGASGIVGKRLLECLGPGERVTLLTRGDRSQKGRGDGMDGAPGDTPPKAAPERASSQTVGTTPLAKHPGVLNGLDPERGISARVGLPAAGPTRVPWTPPEGPHLMLGGETRWVQLAGSSVVGGRLGPDHEKRLLSTRVAAGMGLMDAWRKAGGPPGAMVVASATGFFGHRGDDPCREEDGPGEGPLARVCRDHEAWWREREGELAAKGCRLVVARLGLVLDPGAPALQKLLFPIRWGLGGPMGGGRMWWPWVTGLDAARALVHLARTPEARGIYHLTAPEPCRQGELTVRLATALGRPAFIPVPGWALRLALGGGADGLLLNSCRAETPRLLASGFTFDAPDLSRALPFVLKVFGR